MTAHILVIEDNPANLELMTYLLHAFGHRPQSAKDGSEGLQALAQGKPELILCDIQLPDFDGFELIQRFKGNPAWCDIPVLAVTALAMLGDRDRVLAAGFDGYIPKPINPEVFVQQVDACLAPAQRSPGLSPSRSDRQVSQPTQNRRPLILVVDNTAVNRELAQSILQPDGFDVIAVSTVESALDSARSRRPDLILSEVNLEGHSGFDLLTAIKRDSVLRSIPFLILTGTCDNEVDRAKGLALGADAYLFQPIEPRMLLETIRSLLREAA